MRRFVQIAFFALFIALFIGTVPGFPVLGVVPSDIFLRTSPLIALATVTASRTVVWTMVLPSIVAIIVTVVLGRVYCGWFCPFGTLIDTVEKFVFRKRRGVWDQERSDRWRAAKYLVLACALGAALFSYQPLLFLDPISMLHRSAEAAVDAPIDAVTKDAAAELYKPLAERGIRLTPPGERRVVEHGTAIIAMLVTVLALSGIQRRFWCRYLCPLGALLALTAWVPILRRKVDGSCNHCLRCERQCKMGCIYERGTHYRSRECIACYECEVVCPQGSVTFPIGHDLDAAAAGMDRSHQLSRRRVLVGAFAGLGWFLAMKSSPTGRLVGGSVRNRHPLAIRPPGALPEKDFLELCARCGECVKVCPTNAIHPALHECGAEGLFTPIVVPRIGTCKEKCNACSLVCPTGAIQPFYDEEKNARVTPDPIIIGLAQIDRSTCRPWYSDRACSVCDEQCPYDAICSPLVEGMQRPYVIERLCTGCGACEHECPVEPVAAIRVTNRGEQRPILPRRGGLKYGLTRQSEASRVGRKILPERDEEGALSVWERTMGRLANGNGGAGDSGLGD